MDCTLKNEALGEHVGESTLSEEWIVQVSSLVSKQSRSLGLQVGSRYLFLHLLKLKLCCLNATTSAGCSEWVQICCPWAVLLPGSSFTHHSLPQGGNFLKNRDFNRSFHRNVHLWKMMKHGQSNLINWMTILCKWKHSQLVQSFSPQKYSIHILSNAAAAPSLKVTKEHNPGQYEADEKKGI